MKSTQGERKETESHNRLGARHGSALLVGVVIITLMSALVLGYLATAVDAERVSGQNIAERRLENAARSVLARATHELWGGFQRATPGARQTHWDAKAYFDGLGVLDQSGAPEPLRTDLLARIDLPRSLVGDPEFSRVEVEGLQVWRVDGRRDLQLFMEASVRERSGLDGPVSPSLQRTAVRETYRIEGPRWEGLDFALLANNINCIMCHAEVDSAPRFYNTDPAHYGQYDRVKLGSLESFQLRDAPDSSVAGTLYLAGLGLHDDGTPITDWGGVDLKSREFDLEGHLLQDAWGNLTPRDLSPASTSAPQPLENLYLAYGSGGAEGQVDGYLPSVFPSPFPDDGGFDFDTGTTVPENAGNRILDPSEFDAVAASVGGSLSGGSISVAAPGEQFDSSAALGSFFETPTTNRLDGMQKGNVHLYGTPDNPIQLNGDVAIEGDLILHGTVTGSGSLLVAGNVYIPGDLVMADGTNRHGERTYGVSANGDSNVLAIASGGNVMVGNFFHPAFGQGAPANGEPDGSFNFIMEELAIFNRMEWLKTQPTLAGKRTRTKIGETTKLVKKWNYEEVEYTKTVSVYENIDGYRVKVGTKEVTRTRSVRVGEPWYEEQTVAVYEYDTPRYENPYYQGADYIARYYSFTEDSKVPVFNKKGYFDPGTNTWLSEERAGGWNTRKLTIADPTNLADRLLYNADGTPRAVVSALTTTGGWIDDDVLREALDAIVSRRADADSAFEIDATLYSSNSIFGVIPSREQEGVTGSLLVNGSIVAADIGVLAPKGVRVNYDERGRELLDLRSDSRLTIRRQLSVPAPTRP